MILVTLLRPVPGQAILSIGKSLGRKLPDNVAAGVFLPGNGSFSPAATLNSKGKLMIFDKTKARVSTLVNDRITAPVTTALVMSALAFIMAGLALALVITGERHASS